MANKGIHLCLPSKRGQIFLQHVMPPWLVYWPNDVSKKKRGMPQENRNSIYGTKKAPLQIIWEKGKCVNICTILFTNVTTCLTSKEGLVIDVYNFTHHLMLPLSKGDTTTYRHVYFLYQLLCIIWPKVCAFCTFSVRSICWPFPNCCHKT